MLEMSPAAAIFKDPSPKVSYYEPNTIDYESESGRRYVLNSLRILKLIL